VTDPNRGSVVSGAHDDNGVTWYRVYFDAVRSGDKWVLDKFYNNDMAFTAALFDKNDMRRVAHADPHTVIINDSTTNTGEIGWYRLSLAEYREGKGYDHMGFWTFNTGDILGNGTATRYIVGAANVSYSGPSHYTLYEVVRSGDGWEVPAYVDAGIPLDTGLVQLDAIPYELVDHTDPHFAVVTDTATTGGLTYAGLSLGEILEGTLGYPPEGPGPIGGSTGYFLVSTVPAGAAISLVDISGTAYPVGNTTAGPLNVTIYLTATPMRSIVANLSGYRDAVYNITDYPAQGETVPVTLTLEPISDPQPFKPLSVPGRIQAEDYNLGGEGVAYHDTTPGNEGGAYRHDDVDIETGNGVTDVGWIRNGEYLTYTVNVTETGDYLVSARVASPNSGRYAAFSVDGGRPISIRVPNTGSFDTYVTATLASTFDMPGVTATQTPMPTATGIENQLIPIRLTAGTHVIEIVFTGDGQNLDWFELTPYVPPTPTPTPVGPQSYKPLSIPGTIQAEDYNLGGEGVAYHDTTPGNEGGAYRHDDVDIETGNGITNVGWIRSGEYLTYTANITDAGQYTMSARVASPNSGRTIAVSVDGAAAATIAVPNSGSFEAFRTVEVPVTLAAGTHTLKLVFAGDGQNLDWISFSQGPITTTPTPTPVPSGASFVAVPTTAAHGSAVKFTVTPASGKSIGSAWWSFDAPAHLNTWNSRATNPTFFYPAAGTFSPLVKITYTDGSTETVQRTNYIRAT
ncbi:MAG: carbohydrate-binding protein, partial [Methanospirillum sp.]